MNRMNKHTPGPWVVHPQALMAVHQPKLECWIPQNKEDAQLIAAAPDLLEALQNLENDDGSIPHHAWAMVQTAIAKATGVQP